MLKLIFIFLLGAVLSSCGFVFQQLSDKAMEDRLLKPGALDSPIPWNLKTYGFRFLPLLNFEWVTRVLGCRGPGG